MNKTTAILCSVLLVGLFSGCGSPLKEIITKSQSTRSDIFVEIKNDEAIPTGYSDVIIKVSVKTPPPGFYLCESNDSLSVKPELPFIFNIDEQAVIWKINGQLEITSIYNKKRRRIPDGGEGIRYVLHKKIRLKLGPHKVFFGFPKSECIREFDILLTKGISRLDIKPVYRLDRLDRQRSRSFLNGLIDFEVFHSDNIISKAFLNVWKKN